MYAKSLICVYQFYKTFIKYICGGLAYHKTAIRCETDKGRGEVIKDKKKMIHTIAGNYSYIEKTSFACYDRRYVEKIICWRMEENKMIEIAIDLLEIDGSEGSILFYGEESGCKYVSKETGMIISKEEGKNSFEYKFVVEDMGNIGEQEKVEKILYAFDIKMSEIKEKQKEDYESGLEAEMGEEIVEDTIQTPYNPELITVAPATFSLKEIVDMIDGEDGEEPTLDLTPDFQREFVWDSTRKSRLIESIMLKIPLPVFYFSRDKEGKLQVVDGVQRLTTIYRFFKNKFKLTNLEYLKDCEGKYFKNKKYPEEKSLRMKLVRELRQYQISCNVIEPSTPENVKLDIFKRLNTGGKALNAQEVRHAFMKKEVREFVQRLVQSEDFVIATNNSIKDTRMMAQELILRYIGYYSLLRKSFLEFKYSPNTTEFIDNVAIALNDCKNIPYNQIEEEFCGAMRKAYSMFGKHAFRRVIIDETENVSSRGKRINKSLFVCFAIALIDYDEDRIADMGNVSKEFAYYLDESKFDVANVYYLKDSTMPYVKAFIDKYYS